MRPLRSEARRVVAMAEAASARTDYNFVATAQTECVSRLKTDKFLLAFSDGKYYIYTHRSSTNSDLKCLQC